tara:strand:- start:12284 stop:12916 length:633 start_codon:yes stop_codon:yes gene_type:complete
MALRSTYNSGVYNSGLYGEPETTQGAASTSVSITTTSSAVTVIAGAATASVTVSASNPTLVKIVDGSANVSLQGIATVSAVKYDVISGFRPGYGENTYGSFVYGENQDIGEGAINANISITATASAQVTRNVASTASVVISATASGFMSNVGASNATISISTNIGYNRVRLFSSATSFTFTSSASGRYKWLDVVDPSTTWTDADILERAA